MARTGKSGQVESIGLILIVVLIALAIIFTLPFLLNSPELQSLNQQYLRLKADSTLSALLATTITNCSLTISQELANCQLNSQPECMATCQQLHKEIQHLIETSTPKSMAYEFLINNQPIANTSKANCQNKLQSAQHFLLDDTPVSIQICA